MKAQIVNTQTIRITCPHCAAVNRWPEDKLDNYAQAKCGKCHQLLFDGRPFALDATNFKRHAGKSDIPLLVDFWAEWCGPCKMMAPNFAAAAADLEPDVRLAKVDTEAEQALAARYNIRSIPSLVLFKGGKEIARSAGAMDKQAIVRWTQQYL